MRAARNRLATLQANSCARVRSEWQKSPVNLQFAFNFYFHSDINLKKLAKLKSSNNTNDAQSSNELDAYVPLNKVRKATILKLQLTPESPNTPYNVFIRAERKADVFLGKSRDGFKLIEQPGEHNWALNCLITSCAAYNIQKQV